MDFGVKLKNKFKYLIFSHVAVMQGRKEKFEKGLN